VILVKTWSHVWRPLANNSFVQCSYELVRSLRVCLWLSVRFCYDFHVNSSFFLGYNKVPEENIRIALSRARTWDSYQYVSQSCRTCEHVLHCGRRRVLVIAPPSPISHVTPRARIWHVYDRNHGVTTSVVPAGRLYAGSPVPSRPLYSGVWSLRSHCREVIVDFAKWYLRETYMQSVRSF